LSLSVISDYQNYFKFQDEESECPTEILEETVLTSATASEWMCHCECKSDHGNFKTNKNTSEKVNCSSLIFGLFFSFDTDSNGHPIDNGKPTSALRLVNSERHRNWTALSNVHFQYRGSIEYHDTWDGIVIVAAISVIAQHYWWGRPTPRPISLTDISETAHYFIKCESAKMWSEWQEFKMW